jgi:hypothetical protein
MLIPVLSTKLDAKTICNELRNHGLVVIETSRTHAKLIAAEVKCELGIVTDSDGGPLLIHLSTEVDDQGWSEFLIYSETYEYQPGMTQDLVRVAVRSWRNKGAPDVHYARVRV